MILALLLAFLSGIAAIVQSAVPIEGRVLETTTNAPISAATVEVIPSGAATQTDAEGWFRLDLPAGTSVAIRVSRLGYATLDTVLALPGDSSLVIRLERRPVALGGLTARGLRVRSVRAGRELFEAEVQPGLVGVSRAEIAELPAMGEPDVLRALQALPGVVAVNDLSAALHVMGGGPDQNVFLWDGARVFAPYHMFGILGAFPTAAIDGVEFYRGAIPARYGEALSSVVDIRQGGRGDDFFVDASVGVVAVGVTAGGRLPGMDGRWMIGGRRTHVDESLSWLMQRAFPYAFDDAHALLTWSPTGAHEIRASFLGSNDQFHSITDVRRHPVERFDLRTNWSNRVASASWTWALADKWTSRVSGSWSGYDGLLEIGDERADYGTNDRVGLGGIELQVQGEMEQAVVRIGTTLESGIVTLEGSESEGGYIAGRRDGEIRRMGAFVELDAERGPFRFGPALRADFDALRGRVYVQPRVTVRYAFSEGTSLTVGGGRTVQWLRTMHDARNVLPGAPLWLAPAPGEPVSISDGLRADLTTWVGRLWSLDLAGYARRFTDIPIWLPEGSRRIDDLRFDDGRAAGLEFMVRRHGRDFSGWFSYALARVRHTDGQSGLSYEPAWDRRHAIDVAVFARGLAGLEVSARATFGTGTPFWPFSGFQIMPRLNTNSQNLKWIFRDRAPYWGRTQMRMPTYFRLDLGARWEAALWGMEWEPFAGLLNVTARPNVLYYRADVPADPPTGWPQPTLLPVSASPTNWIPSLGLNVYF